MGGYNYVQAKDKGVEIPQSIRIVKKAAVQAVAIAPAAAAAPAAPVEAAVVTPPPVVEVTPPAPVVVAPAAPDPGATIAPAVTPAVVMKKAKTKKIAPKVRGGAAKPVDQPAPVGTSPCSSIPYTWTPNSSDFTGLELVGLATQRIGVKYVWGGSCPNRGFDCSGLIQYLFWTQKIGIPRTAQEQYDHGIRIPKGSQLAGDLVFFYEGSGDHVGHVGIYVGNDWMIEAPHTGDVVKQIRFSTYADHIMRWAGVRRYTTG